MTANNYVLVSETDDWVEKILNKPHELKLTENTLVIFLSDHGEMPGQYGMCGKFCFYDKSVRPKYDFTVSECSWEKVNVSSIMNHTENQKLMTIHRTEGKNIEAPLRFKNEPFESE